LSGGQGPWKHDNRLRPPLQRYYGKKTRATDCVSELIRGLNPELEHHRDIIDLLVGDLWRKRLLSNAPTTKLL